MLSIMRKKAGSWMLKVILGLIAVVFVFWGFGSQRSNNRVEVASVNGEPIAYDEYKKQYDDMVEEFRRRLGENFNEDILKNLHLEKRALDSLIERRLMLSEAEKLHIMVTEEELDMNIVQMPAFQKAGRFDNATYMQVLGYLGMTPEAFKAMQREALIIEKLRLLIESSVKVSEDEAEEWYRWKNAEVNIDFVQFLPSRYSTVGPLTDEELKTFYDTNKSRYQTKPKIKVQYIRFNPDDYASMVHITDEDVQEYYESHIEEFETPKTVEARHILVKVDPNAPDDVVQEGKQRALAIMNRAKEGDDFASLARKYSDGPSKDNGGYLGVFKKSAMVKPFADKAFSMKAGEISEPVRTQFGWHIIKVEKVNEAHSVSEKEAKKNIVQKIRAERAKSLAYDAAEEIYDVLLDVDNLKKAADEKKLKAVTTDYITQTSDMKDIVDQDKFKSVAFKLSEGEISDVYDFGDGYYVLQVVDRVPERIPELEEIRQTVRADLIKEKRNEKAAEDARMFLEALKAGASMNTESKKYHVHPESTGFFSRDGEIPKIGYEKNVSQTAFQLSDTKPLPENVIAGNNGYYIIRFKSRREPDIRAFENKKNDVYRELLEEKKSKTFDTWLSQVKANSDIKIEDNFPHT